MKLSAVLEGPELSKSVLEALEHVTDPLINEVVEKYDRQLRENGEYLSPDEKRTLKTYMAGAISIKLNLCVNLSEHKMQKWGIFPTSFSQTTFETNDLEIGEDPEKVEQLKNSILLNFEAGSPEEGGVLAQMPDGTGWDVLEPDLSEYSEDPESEEDNRGQTESPVQADALEMLKARKKEEEKFRQERTQQYNKMSKNKKRGRPVKEKNEKLEPTFIEKDPLTA